MAIGQLYAEPKTNVNLSDCAFYHTMKIPGYGRIEGEWEIRPRQYLGGVDFRGKRVLELGTADGYLCFYMEHQGADVVACDLSPDASLDMVPMSRIDHEALEHRTTRYRQ
jgi:2-polyprenyl-3-methyl-5-hydroxy-6-metoxy-1,4-benzoquinol methylase